MAEYLKFWIMKYVLDIAFFIAGLLCVVLVGGIAAYFSKK